MTAVEQAPPGDAASFASWVGPHLAVMSHLAARLSPTADRDDIVQNSLLRAWRRRTTFDVTKGTARAWLCAITADQARRARRRARPAIPVVQPGPTYDADLFLDLERALAQLPARQREAVDLVYIVGLTIAEAATVMGVASGTVKSTLSDARAKLRPLLEVTG